MREGINMNCWGLTCYSIPGCFTSSTCTLSLSNGVCVSVHTSLIMVVSLKVL